MSYYITTNRSPRFYQLTFEDIMHGVDESKLAPQKDTRDTTTWKVENVSRNLISKTNLGLMYRVLCGFVDRYSNLISMDDKSSLYYSFKIPKRSGGLRQIDAPNDELKKALYDLKHIFEHTFYASYNTAAFAYVHGRCTVDAVRRHQQNKSRWFLKMDMKHFFPSITPDFLLDMLCMTFPFCCLVEYSNDSKELLRKALSLCFLNGGLPQGTPTSPMLTNMLMIPIDYAINKMCREHKPHLCYTRYADDLLISSVYDFNWKEVRDNIVGILNEFNAPFGLNPEKTRFGSSSGRNWNLGVMLNADNNITIGFQRKKTYKAMCFQFMTDVERGFNWELSDIQHFLGLTSYYRMIEKDSIDAILAMYSSKFGKDVESTAKSLLKAS